MPCGRENEPLTCAILPHLEPGALLLAAALVLAFAERTRTCLRPTRGRSC